MHVQCKSQYNIKAMLLKQTAFYYVNCNENGSVPSCIAVWSFAGTDDFVLILHSGLISRDISLFKKHFYSYISVIPGVTVQNMVLIEVKNH